MLLISLDQIHFQHNDGDTEYDVLNIKEPNKQIEQPHGFCPTLCQGQLASRFVEKFLPVQEERRADNSPQGMQEKVYVFPEMCTESFPPDAKTPEGNRQNSISNRFHIIG